MFVAERALAYLWSMGARHRKLHFRDPRIRAVVNPDAGNARGQGRFLNVFSVIDYVSQA